MEVTFHPAGSVDFTLLLCENPRKRPLSLEIMAKAAGADHPSRWAISEL